MSIRRSVNLSFAAKERMTGVPGVHVDFTGKGCSMELNGFFLISGIREMVK